MAMSSEGTVLRHFRRLFTQGTVAGLTEGQLLERFVTQRDEAAFEALIARHGPMVLGVCRRVLSDPHDAEDAFQATFLLLVRKAAGLRNRELVGNWLYGVAYRVAVRSRQTAARRFLHERPGHGEHAVEPNCEPLADDLRPVLLEEVSLLPEKYRAPVVLCYFEGQTHEEAAAQLRWPLGTVKGRLARAREQLRSRLLKRGVVGAPAGLLLVELAEGASAACLVPAGLMESTLKAAMAVAAGNAAAGAVSASAAALFEGVLRTMFISKLKIVTAAAVSAGMLASGAGLLAYQFGGASGAPNQPGGRFGVAPASGGTSGPAPSSASKRLAVAQQALQAAEKMMLAGEMPDSNLVSVWSRRLAETLDEMSQDQAGRLAALQAHLDRMKLFESRAKTMHENGQMSELSFLEAQFRRAEAEDWLAQAQTQTGTGAGMMGLGGSMATGMGTAGRRPGGMMPGVGGGGMGGSMSGPPAAAQGAGFGMGFVGGMGGGEMNPLARSPVRILSLEESRKDPRNQRILEKLEQPIPMEFADETPLRDVINYIKAATADEKNDKDDGIPIYLDPKGIKEGEFTFESPVKIDLKGIPLKTTLRLLLGQLDMAYAVKEGILIIGDRSSEELAAPSVQPK
jgi:RNA polymerase sigma factor (sigma-70 family)